MNRRDSIQKFVLGGTVLVLAPGVLQSCSKDPSTNPGGGGTPPPAGTKITLDLTLPANAALNTAGGSLITQTVLVINTGTGYVALTSICTHEQNTVGYNAPSGTIICPFHGSQFTITGSVVNGPAASPLRSYPVSKTGDILTISI
jgi:cytochrome b6-f complex iron-sulfur subunit